jgi:hypothetical protein|nr:MAG TPA: hypothetical protein [Bacteriophage sp.]
MNTIKFVNCTAYEVRLNDGRVFRRPESLHAYLLNVQALIRMVSQILSMRR